MTHCHESVGHVLSCDLLIVVKWLNGQVPDRPTGVVLVVRPLHLDWRCAPLGALGSRFSCFPFISLKLFSVLGHGHASNKCLKPGLLS